ncbi:unnamed protein product, partial [Effrenium voratum]
GGGDPSTQEVAETVMAQAQSQTDAERKEVLTQEASVQDRRNLVTGHVPSDDDEAPVQDAKRPRLEAGAVRKADLQQVLRDRGIAFASKTTVAELRSLLDEAAEAVVAVEEAADAEEVEESEETEDVAVDVAAVETKETVEKDKADDAVVEADFGGALPVLQGSSGLRWMMEPINVEALEMAGSLRAFGQLGLREQVADMLTRDYEEAQKKGTISEEIHGRFLELPLVVRRLVDMRISSYNATRSAFSFHKLFKGQDCRSVTWTRLVMRSNGAGMCHLETFMQKHQLQKLPHFVSELMHEIRAITQRDAQAYPELSAELAAQGGNWKGQLLELLHEIQEHGGF